MFTTKWDNFFEIRYVYKFNVELDFYIALKQKTMRSHKPPYFITKEKNVL